MTYLFLVFRAETYKVGPYENLNVCNSVTDYLTGRFMLAGLEVPAMICNGMV